MEKLIICTVCPQGCRITVTGEGSNIASVTGFTCARGEAYAKQEFVCPMRILTENSICGYWESSDKTDLTASGNGRIPAP